MIEFVSTWLASIPGYMAPLLLASLGLILCERVGVLNLGSEGIAAMGAMTGATVVLAGFSPFVAFSAGALAGLLMSLPLILAVVVLRAPQILAGLAVVAIGLGGSAALGRDVAHNPFAGLKDFVPPPALADIPLLGGFLFAQNYVVYFSVLLAIGLGYFISRTHVGLRLRAVGEDPATADAAGVSIQLYQTLAVAAGCVLIGLAGAYLSVAGSQVWTDGMVAGRGWIALALVVFARWSPINAIFGALLFGGADALIPRLQAIGLEVPVYLLSMLPYVLTIVVLVAVSVFSPSNRSEPGFLGRAYVRQDR